MLLLATLLVATQRKSVSPAHLANEVDRSATLRSRCADVAIPSVGSALVEIQVHSVERRSLRSSDGYRMDVRDRHELDFVHRDRMHQDADVLEGLHDEDILPQHMLHDPAVPIHKAAVLVHLMRHVDSHAMLEHHWASSSTWIGRQPFGTQDLIRCIGVVQLQPVRNEVRCAAVGDRQEGEAHALVLSLESLRRCSCLAKILGQDPVGEESGQELPRRLLDSAVMQEVQHIESVDLADSCCFNSMRTNSFRPMASSSASCKSGRPATGCSCWKSPTNTTKGQGLSSPKAARSRLCHTKASIWDTSL